MFRILKIYDDSTAASRERMAQVQAILRTQFPGLEERDIAKLPEQLRDPFKYRFRAILLIAEDGHGLVCGFALLLHAPDLSFAYLDYISTGRDRTSGGIGSALYERVREEALGLSVIGVFFECLPDDPALSPDQRIRKQNAARLRFYERYGARPIINTAYETPLSPGDTDPPYLVFDDLGQEKPLGRAAAKHIVRAILERKYGTRCPPAYVDKVVNSFRDDPIQLRAAHYRVNVPERDLHVPPRMRRIALVINEGHTIHHVRDRGYVQAPVRVASINRELERSQLFETIAARRFPESHIKAVHEADFVDYLKRACAHTPENRSVYPYVFPIRNRTKPPKELPLRAGYYCIDTFTPLNRNAYHAAIGAVNCALTAAAGVLEGYGLAYALVRPPGHHAERNSFGGFCYFNSAAIAAHYLSQFGKVALLDIDYHHGNGTQDIFYDRADVLTISLHGHPRFTYPYFSGYEDERGINSGRGFNVNIPLPENIDGARYRKELQPALDRIDKFDPRFLVVSLGLDTAKGDPTGSFTLIAQDFRDNGRLIGKLKLPTLVVQEGGYRIRTLGSNARNFFHGLWQGSGRPLHSSPRRSNEHDNDAAG